MMRKKECPLCRHAIVLEDLPSTIACSAEQRANSAIGANGAIGANNVVLDRVITQQYMNACITNVLLCSTISILLAVSGVFMYQNFIVYV